MGRKPKCKTCVSYTPQDDGTVECEYSGRKIDPESSPLYDEGACYERAPKKKLTPAELSFIRSKAGRKGGRKAGYGKGRAPTRQIQVRKCDHEVFFGYSQKNKRAMAEQFHVITTQIVAKHPELKPPDWID